MPYATQADLQAQLAPERLAALADDDSDGAPDAAVLNALLADASAYIDQQLAARYVTPVASPPSVLALWCAALTLEALHQRRNAELPKPLTEAADLARRALEAIHDGLANLAGAEPRLADLICGIEVPDIDPIFTFDTLELF